VSNVRALTRKCPLCWSERAPAIETCPACNGDATVAIGLLNQRGNELHAEAAELRAYVAVRRAKRKPPATPTPSGGCWHTFIVPGCPQCDWMRPTEPGGAK
jgi:hypothetical protein